MSQARNATALSINLEVESDEEGDAVGSPSPLPIDEVLHLSLESDSAPRGGLERSVSGSFQFAIESLSESRGAEEGRHESWRRARIHGPNVLSVTRDLRGLNSQGHGAVSSVEQLSISDGSPPNLPLSFATCVGGEVAGIRKQPALPDRGSNTSTLSFHAASIHMSPLQVVGSAAYVDAFQPQKLVAPAHQSQMAQFRIRDSDSDSSSEPGHDGAALNVTAVPGLHPGMTPRDALSDDTVFRFTTDDAGEGLLGNQDSGRQRSQTASIVFSFGGESVPFFQTVSISGLSQTAQRLPSTNQIPAMAPVPRPDHSAAENDSRDVKLRTTCPVAKPKGKGTPNGRDQRTRAPAAVEWNSDVTVMYSDRGPEVQWRPRSAQALPRTPAGADTSPGGARCCPGEVEGDAEEECTFHPHINPRSASMVRRESLPQGAGQEAEGRARAIQQANLFQRLYRDGELQRRRLQQNLQKKQEREEAEAAQIRAEGERIRRKILGLADEDGQDSASEPRCQNARQSSELSTSDLRCGSGFKADAEDQDSDVVDRSEDATRRAEHTSKATLSARRSRSANATFSRLYADAGRKRISKARKAQESQEQRQAEELKDATFTPRINLTGMHQVGEGKSGESGVAGRSRPRKVSGEVPIWDRLIARAPKRYQFAPSERRRTTSLGEGEGIPGPRSDSHGSERKSKVTDDEEMWIAEEPVGPPSPPGAPASCGGNDTTAPEGPRDNQFQLPTGVTLGSLRSAQPYPSMKLSDLRHEENAHLGSGDRSTSSPAVTPSPGSVAGGDGASLLLSSAVPLAVGGLQWSLNPPPLRVSDLLRHNALVFGEDDLS